MKDYPNLMTICKYIPINNLYFSGIEIKYILKKTARDPDSRINKSLRKWNC
jgi:hypothetical protein